MFARADADEIFDVEDIFEVSFFERPLMCDII
jgi:hypothetical protein